MGTSDLEARRATIVHNAIDEYYIIRRRKGVLWWYLTLDNRWGNRMHAHPESELMANVRLKNARWNGTEGADEARVVKVTVRRKKR